jgi:hypothetical protein
MVDSIGDTEIKHESRSLYAHAISHPNYKLYHCKTRGLTILKHCKKLLFLSRVPFRNLSKLIMLLSADVLFTMNGAQFIRKSVHARETP